MVRDTEAVPVLRDMKTVHGERHKDCPCGERHEGHSVVRDTKTGHGERHEGRPVVRYTKIVRGERHKDSPWGESSKAVVRTMQVLW